MEAERMETERWSEQEDGIEEGICNAAVDSEVVPLLKWEDGEVEDDEFDQSPVEQVALTVSTADDPTLPVFTFRMWTLGITSCVILSFLNTFFSYRREPLSLTASSAQIAALPIGHFMAAVLPTKKFRLPISNWEFTLNPGPFNVKEHVLISIFGSAGSAFGSGEAFAINVVTSIKAFYKRDISFVACTVIVITSHVLGYGWAGLLRRFLVDPSHMWWPSSLTQVSMFRTLHETSSGKGLSRGQFFVIALTGSFAYYVIPGYMFSLLSSVSFICYIWPKSIIAHQIGSGLNGLGVGSFSFDWAGITAFLGSPLVTPWPSIVNIGAGTLIFLYIVVPLAYWHNVYDAKTFPIYSNGLFRGDGQKYNFTGIVDKNFRLDVDAYAKYGTVHISTIFCLSYGMGFAAITSTLTHLALFHGRQVWQRLRSSIHEDHADVHTRLMKKYPDIPSWWFLLSLGTSILLTIAVCEGYKDQLQLPWWGVLLACAISSVFTLPAGILIATTNQAPGLNVISEYIIGYILPGQPIASMLFKTYSQSGTGQAIHFLADFKLGHYMKIPPRSMFIVQVVGALTNAMVNLKVAWWMLETIPNICDTDLLPPESLWTCPGGKVFFDASVVWGLVGPRRIFGPEGIYNNVNWFFLVGAILPIPVWILFKSFPKAKWISLINVPIIMHASSVLPPASSVNVVSWLAIGTIFNYYIYRFRKRWWQKYNYLLSAALDAGTAFMAVLLYFTLEIHDKKLSWWANRVDHCPLASCQTA